MSEKQTNEEAQPTQPTENNVVAISSEGTQKTEPATENMIPQSRFSEVNEARKAEAAKAAELAAKVAAYEAAERQREEEAAKKRGEYDRLLAERDAKIKALLGEAERVEHLTAALQETIAARVEEIPEDMRSLVPGFSDPRDTLAWLNTNMDRLRKPAPVKLDMNAHSTAPLTSKTPIIELTEEEAYFAELLGNDPKEVAAIKARRQRR